MDIDIFDINKQHLTNRLARVYEIGILCYKYLGNRI